MRRKVKLVMVTALVWITGAVYLIQTNRHEVRDQRQTVTTGRPVFGRGFWRFLLFFFFRKIFFFTETVITPFSRQVLFWNKIFFFTFHILFIVQQISDFSPLFTKWIIILNSANFIKLWWKIFMISLTNTVASN